MYEEWFRRLLAVVAGRQPVVEIGTGPGFFKEFAPRLVATDVLPGSWVDVSCDAAALPFRSGQIGALVMVDALHHLPRPLQFIDEAARVLQPGGRLAMLEPWITPMSYVLYRYFHHEDCRLGVDVTRPFAGDDKAALDGNAAIPYLVLRRLISAPCPLRVVTREPFVALPYLATLGFQMARPMPRGIVRFAGALERLAWPLRPLLATRVFAVLEKPAVPSPGSARGEDGRD